MEVLIERGPREAFLKLSQSFFGLAWVFSLFAMQACAHPNPNPNPNPTPNPNPNPNPNPSPNPNPNLEQLLDFLEAGGSYSELVVSTLMSTASAWGSTFGSSAWRTCQYRLLET